VVPLDHLPQDVAARVLGDAHVELGVVAVDGEPEGGVVAAGRQAAEEHVHLLRETPQLEALRAGGPPANKRAD
jgi:hypothetical protein